MALKKPKRAGKKKKKNERRNLQSKHRTKAFFIPHVSGMCLTSNTSKLCNSFFKALPLTDWCMKRSHVLTFQICTAFDWLCFMTPCYNLVKKGGINLHN